MTKKLDQRTAIEKFNDPNNLFLTTKEVAKLLGVAYSTVMNAYRETGEIMVGVPVHKIGTKTLKVRASDLRKIVGA